MAVEMDMDASIMSADNPVWRAISILPCTKEFEKSDPEQANTFYERALHKNSGSYKLWRAYLLHRVRQLDGKPLNDSIYEEANICFERALYTMHKMPRIWIEYCTLLTRQLFINRTRQTFNRALEALPITQHSRIWPLYIEFIKQEYIPIETGMRVYKRYMQLQPENAEDYIDYLCIKNRMDEAAILLCDIINRPNFQSKRNKTKYELCEDLYEMICDHADSIQSIDVDAILRDGIQRYRNQQGKLWNALARYYTSLGLFTKARDVYEEAIHVVTTKKDFAEVWDAYSKSEEEYIKYMLSDDHQLSEDEMLDLEIRKTAFENLVEKRELMSNSVSLRQNPHNVREWQKRVQLFDRLYDFDPEKDEHNSKDFDRLVKSKLETLSTAVKTVDCKQAVGKYEDLWIELALSYEKLSLNYVRLVFEQATRANYNKVDDLANVWCAYVEFELKSDLIAGNPIPGGACMRLIQRAVSIPAKSVRSDNQTVQNRLYRCLKLWLLHADLEENFGSFDATKAVYDEIIRLKIATPQVVLNYAKLLEEKHYFEHAFRVYENGVALFKWPNVYSIWSTYLVHHIRILARSTSIKLARIRDLFEQCLKDCPSDYSKEIYLLYAKLELEHGLLSRAIDVYKRATKSVEKSQKASIYRIFIRSMMKIVDINQLRPFYEAAIADLDNKDARNFSLEYAKLETKLGEIDRARTIYSHCSQMCDPKYDGEFWESWKEFEQEFGDEDTHIEYFRIKRSVQTLFANSGLQSVGQGVSFTKGSS